MTLRLPKILAGALAAALLVLAAATAGAQTRELASRGILLDRIAAIVNDGVVLKSELDEQTSVVVQRIEQQNKEVPPLSVLRQQILDRLVLQEIQWQRANRIGIKVSDEMVNDALQDMATRNKLTLSQLPDVLEQQGINYASYRESLRREIALSILRQRDVVSHIVVTPHEIEQYLAKKDKSGENLEFNVAHILLSLPLGATPEQIDRVTARAKEVHDRAAEGEDFSQLAIAYSNSQTALDGGQLGWKKSTQLPSFLADIVTAMKPGDVSAPLRTPSGYHIVKLIDRRGAAEQVMVNQVHVRHILMKPNELQDDQTVRQKLADLRAKIMAGDDFAAIASATSEDPGSATDGGDLGWSGPGTFVPEFEREVQALQENEISEPFHSQYGWHIVQLLGRRVHDNTKEQQQQMAFEALRDSKLDEETEIWLRHLKDEAYVDLKM
ncbi:MAG TPA: peptidylprolyl isomerase [Steroidobacteraceae bacterium]|nr:peptidylprolyl isomerase [Steroidobacteraceae bacterium]